MIRPIFSYVHALTRPASLASAVMATLALLVWLVGCSGPREEPTFVGGAVCADCHQREKSLWKHSHRDLAMTVATDATVLGDFSGTTFTRFGVTSRFLRKDGKFFVNTEGPGGKFDDFEIKYTFGWDPLQRRPDEAEKQLIEANRIDPDSADILAALALYYARRQDGQRAAAFAGDLVRRHLEYPEARDLFNRIQSRRAH